MENRPTNRLKVVLAERRLTNKWLATQLGVDQTTVSKWCTNSSQPDIFTFSRICRILNTRMEDMIRETTAEMTDGN
ncbi:MAG: helix-turn-helix transcriptional regulator [Muribaculaceae bacterium]|nr:helix-turn-helix transcriptional regulator [Muribaculaceae bacterium]